MAHDETPDSRRDTPDRLSGRVIVDRPFDQAPTSTDRRQDTEHDRMRKELDKLKAQHDALQRDYEGLKIHVLQGANASVKSLDKLTSWRTKARHVGELLGIAVMIVLSAIATVRGGR